MPVERVHNRLKQGTKSRLSCLLLCVCILMYLFRFTPFSFTNFQYNYFRFHQFSRPSRLLSLRGEYLRTEKTSLLTLCKNNVKDTCNHQQEFQFHFFSIRWMPHAVEKTLHFESVISFHYTDHNLYCDDIHNITEWIHFLLVLLESFNQIWCCIHTWKGLI